MKGIMNKKGFLLGEETVKIVIAVVCIVFLIALLVTVYLSVSGDQQSIEAKASMENVLVKEIKGVDAGGQVRPEGILIPNPAGWSLFSFIEGDKKPNLCAGDNCICICQNTINLFNWQINACDKRGTCYVSSKLKKFDAIKIEKSGTPVLVQKINDFIYISKK
jgi:hypothetical protein